MNPFSPTSIRIETKHTMCISEILKRVQYPLRYSFPRSPFGKHWTEVQSSRFIESLFVRIPVPSLYMDGSEDQGWLIIDGMKRMQALQSYILDGRFALCGLEYYPHLNEKRWGDLPRAIQRHIEENIIVTHIVERGVPLETRENIFHRIVGDH